MSNSKPEHVRELESEFWTIFHVRSFAECHRMTLKLSGSTGA
jgi:hypothetical protein